MVGKRQKINFQDNLRAKILASLGNAENREEQEKVITSISFDGSSDFAKTKHTLKDENVHTNVSRDEGRSVPRCGHQYERTLVWTKKKDLPHLKTPKIFSKQQSTIFQYLIFISKTIPEESGQIIREGYSNAKIVSDNTGISFRTCQDILKKLTLWGLIEKHNFQKANWKGFHFIILKENDSCNTYGHSYGHLSSSLDNNKLTTKLKEYISDYLPVDNFLEMGFWQIKPNIITEKQFQAWLEEFKLAPEILITYLDRCRFEMVELGKEEKLNKGSAVNWFYGVMKKRGGSYPEPQGYKSIQELKLEEDKKILANLERIAKEQEQIRLKTEFLHMMENSESELF